MTPRMSVAALALAAALTAGAAGAATVLTVPGNSNPYLSGLPDGSTASRGDEAPDESPVDTGLALTAGQTLAFTVTGFVSHTGSASGPSPDGSAIFTHFPGAQNGISDVTAPINALMGVFLTDERPDASPAPDALDFGDDAARDFATLAPGLKQVFFVGDGRDESGDVQDLVVPEGATRLFLGTMDGFGWFNNSGAFTVTIDGGDPVAPIPLPAAGLVLLAGLGSLGAARAVRRR